MGPGQAPSLWARMKVSGPSSWSCEHPPVLIAPIAGCLAVGGHQIPMTVDKYRARRAHQRWNTYAETTPRSQRTTAAGNCL